MAWASGLGNRSLGLRLGDWDSGFSTWGFRSNAYNLGCRVWELGFTVQGLRISSTCHGHHPLQLNISPNMEGMMYSC